MKYHEDSYFNTTELFVYTTNLDRTDACFPTYEKGCYWLDNYKASTVLSTKFDKTLCEHKITKEKGTIKKILSASKTYPSQYGIFWINNKHYHWNDKSNIIVYQS